MTAATYAPNPLVRGSRTILRWRRLVVVLGVCVPVPLCAASGLSLPLPATVERLAAIVVPWADLPAVAGDALARGTGGAIVGADADDAVETLAAVAASEPVETAGASPGPRSRRGESTFTAARDAAVVAARGEGPVAAATAAAPGTASAAPSRRDAQPPDARSDQHSPSSPVATPAPAPAAPTPAPGPAPSPPPKDDRPLAPVKPVVDEVVAPVQPVVEKVTAPVVEETTKVVETITEPTKEIVPKLPGLGG